MSGSAKTPRILLLWPGTTGAAAGNFGVPQLVLLGTWIEQQTSARVDIRDMETERYLGGMSFDSLFGTDDGKGYDIVAFSIYSSFDHLKCWTLAEMVRERWPDAVIVAGGYHPSARPFEYVRDGSPFDICVVGEGEKPLVTIVESVAGGAPIRGKVMGPDPITDLEVLPPSNWSLLERYRTVARRAASQAQVYLSRGCPFDCAFCMERAKREVSWRALPVERAVEEIVSLHEFLDLRSWTLYFGDALFGMKKSWRRQFLVELAKRNVPVDKFWLLIRVDLVEDEDLRLFGEANCGLGFGLESGDPKMLGIIRKSGRLDTYLDRMVDIADRARAHNVPWGANVICGHPGETRESIKTSAAYLERLFLRSGGTTGFLSVDPFRLYPGSPIDAQRHHYETTYGTRFHRPHWWDDGDPEFLSEWVDPSDELTYLERAHLEHEHLTPILARIGDNFVYEGKARPYFMRAVTGQLAYTSARHRLRAVDRYYAWHQYLGKRATAHSDRRRDAGLRGIGRELRQQTHEQWGERVGLQADGPIADAIREVPRERFVPLDSIKAAMADKAIALDESGLATVSAMHAYARSFDLIGIEPGDRVLDLGAGSGYGTALLAEIVGESGEVYGVEIDPNLADAGAEELEALGYRHATLVDGNALDPADWPAGAHRADKVTVGFELLEFPRAWASVLAVGTVVAAPLRVGGTHARPQTQLVRATLTDEGFVFEYFDAVRYVPTRTKAPARTQRAEVSGESEQRAVRLPLL